MCSFRLCKKRLSFLQDMTILITSYTPLQGTQVLHLCLVLAVKIIMVTYTSRNIPMCFQVFQYDTLGGGEIILAFNILNKRRSKNIDHIDKKTRTT